MARMTVGRRCLVSVLVTGLGAVFFSPASVRLSAQSQDVSPTIKFSTSRLEINAPAAGFAASLFSEPTPVDTGAGAGLVIHATFNANVNAATQTVILNALAFYQNTFTNNITVNIEFYSMNSGLG